MREHYQNKCIILIFGIVFLPGQVIFSQDHETKNNYTGAWETPSSWNPSWALPQYNVDPFDITINGYITVSGSLSFTGTSDIIINDTLVIKGNLSLADNSDLTINNDAILIVRGNLIVNKHAEMVANGYFIVTGNIIKGGPNGEGSLISNDNPVKVFIGGSIPPGLTNDNHKYPALDCTSPPTTPYPHSDCSYGDMTDIVTDPIYSFFQSTCIVASLTSSDADNSFCEGTSITFTASGGGTNYNFRVNASSVQNGGSPIYTTTVLTNGQIVDVVITGTGGCTGTSSGIINTVIALPVPAIVGPATVCVGTAGSVYTSEGGMSNYLWTVSAGGTITAGGGTGNNTVTVTWTTTGAKTVKVNYTNVNGCTATSQTSYNITVNAFPVPSIAGPASVCAGKAGSVYTSEAGMSNYLWTISAGGTITEGGGATNNTVTVSWTTIGSKTVTVNYANGNGCTAASQASYNVTVNPLPEAIASNNGPVCVGNAISLTGGPAAMITYLWTGPNGYTSSLQNSSLSENAAFAIAGVYILTVTNAAGCTSAATTTVTVNENPVAFAGPDQELTFIFQTQMAAELSPPETGEWTLISGSGHFSTINSPTTMLSELSKGENTFLWNVQSGNCKASDEVKIIVFDLFVPTVITPDGDGKNDYFKISENIGKVELIIFNRYGNEEFRSTDYVNDWDGRNNSGAELPYDTYFYVLKLEKAKMKKGSVLIIR